LGWGPSHQGVAMCRLLLLGWGLLGIVPLLGCAGSEAALAQANAGPPTVRAAECRWATNRIRIDGKIDEVAWEKAQLLQDFAVFWEKRKPKTATKARLLWDDRYL